MTGAASRAQEMKSTWEASFSEQIASQAYNTAPVEAVIRHVAYYLRDRGWHDAAKTPLHFMEMGCGAGPNLIWLAKKGITVSGIDISPTALGLATHAMKDAGVQHRVGRLVEGSVTETPWPDQSFDGILEACVFQHLNRADRVKAFGEVRRLLKPGGLFVGYMLDAGHTIFQQQQAKQLAEDPGTLMLQDGSSKFHLSNIGLSHFYRREELLELLRGFSVADPCLATYVLPRAEAQKRGYASYLQSMWIVHAIR